MTGGSDYGGKITYELLIEQVALVYKCQYIVDHRTSGYALSENNNTYGGTITSTAQADINLPRFLQLYQNNVFLLLTY